MNPDIVKNLVDNQIIHPGTELLVSYVNHGSFGLPSTMSESFKVVRVISSKGKYYFTLSSLRDTEKSIVASPEQIKEIDGMTCERLIKAFNLMDDGSKKPRKPRKRKIKLDQTVTLIEQQLQQQQAQ